MWTWLVLLRSCQELFRPPCIQYFSKVDFEEERDIFLERKMCNDLVTDPDFKLICSSLAEHYK